MAPQTPLILVDNFLDTIALYPKATVFASNFITGREPFRVADARRDRSWWQGTANGDQIGVDMGVGNTVNPTYLYFDRGSNLWGGSISLQWSDDNITYTPLWSPGAPALGTVGGDPTSNATLAATEEGALYTIFGPTGAAHRYWRIACFPSGGAAPVIPGVMLGVRTQLLGFSRVRDEDAMTRTDISETSRSGYLASDKRYAWRTLLVDLPYIGATEYDATIRTLRRRLFELDQAAVIAMDYATKPERAWMYRYDGTAFSAPMTRAYRATQFRMREVGPLLG